MAKGDSKVYSPQPIESSDPVEVAAWTTRELDRISQAFDFQSDGRMEVRNVIPGKPREGTFVYADGTNWNPGYGAGPYVYINGLWVPAAWMANVKRAATRKNAVINGAFNVWQRGTTFTSMAASSAFPADRWGYFKSTTTAVHDGIRSTDVPSVAQAGRLFNYSLLIDCTTADAAVGVNDIVGVYQRVEGFNWLPLAQSACAFSFWVKATKTGIYCVSFQNSGQDRCYVAEFTVNSSATWEYKTILLSASPSTGTWDYLTGIGLQVNFILMAGTQYNQGVANTWNASTTFATTNQVNACDSTSNDFRLCGVQLEVGIEATPFEQSSFEEDLWYSNRYFAKTFKYATVPADNFENAGALIGKGACAADMEPFCNWLLPVPMRVTPTVVLYSIAGGAAGQWSNAIVSTANARLGGIGLSEKVVQIDNTGGGSGNAGAQYYIHATASAEL